ncbi:MAG: hypothetical protein PHI50_03735 [Alphaproteobacteria bacterium]|nr:hypothetical protein [Alphaproteobacteria bacterium]
MKQIYLTDLISFIDDKNIFESLFSLFENNLFFIGGVVRDALLGGKNKDIDMATSFPPEQIEALLTKNNIPFTSKGKAFGSFSFTYQGEKIELTSFRKECYGSSRYPKVSYENVSMKEDALRRDFTFNALYLDKKGKLYDFFEGKKDLEEGRVRFIGDISEKLKEDPLRLLRYLRFFSSYGKGDILPKERGLFKDHAFRLKTLSQKRIKKEYQLLLKTPQKEKIFDLLEETEVLNFLPSFFRLK